MRIRLITKEEEEEVAYTIYKFIYLISDVAAFRINSINNIKYMGKYRFFAPSKICSIDEIVETLNGLGFIECGAFSHSQQVWRMPEDSIGIAVICERIMFVCLAELYLQNERHRIDVCIT